MRVTVVARSAAAILRRRCAVLPQLDECVRRFEHHHLRRRAVESDGAIGARIVTGPPRLLDHFEAERIAIKRQGAFEVGNADCDVVDANDHG